MGEEEVEEADNITTSDSDESGRLNREESLDGQLLLEIIRNEENRDLRHLVYTAGFVLWYPIYM